MLIDSWCTGRASVASESSLLTLIQTGSGNLTALERVGYAYFVIGDRLSEARVVAPQGSSTRDNVRGVAW